MPWERPNQSLSKPISAYTADTGQGTCRVPPGYLQGTCVPLTLSGYEKIAPTPVANFDEVAFHAPTIPNIRRIRAPATEIFERFSVASAQIHGRGEETQLSSGWISIPSESEMNFGHERIEHANAPVE